MKDHRNALKSQLGAVLGRIFGSNMKDGSIGKISENRFDRADLERILLCVDDDMQMEALRQSNYIKSIVTGQGRMDLERKSKQILKSSYSVLQDDYFQYMRSAGYLDVERASVAARRNT